MYHSKFSPPFCTNLYDTPECDVPVSRLPVPGTFDGIETRLKTNLVLKKPWKSWYQKVLEEIWYRKRLGIGLG